MHRPAAYWIEHLQLQPHPEGGYYREVYRCSEQIPQRGLPSRFKGARSIATSIYYLLQVGDFSAFHRILSDETWHFYAGEPLEVHQLQHPIDGKGHHITLLGRDLERGEQLQWTVPAGVWFASRPAANAERPQTGTSSGYSLVGCTVSPGFDFADFEMARPGELLEQFPQYAALIAELTQTD